MELFTYIGVLIGSFAILAKSADLFVDGAVTIAEILAVPKIIIGIVLVGFATTAPEFAVSVQSAYLGHPEIALGNAVGSVIADDGLALALAAIIAPTPIPVYRKILRTAGPFLIGIYLVTYAMAFNGTFGRLEGVLLALLLAGYLYSLLLLAKRERGALPIVEHALTGIGSVHTPSHDSKSLRRPGAWFGLGLAGVVLSSRLIIWSSLHLATRFKVPEVVIALTVIAIGTSLPEIATCIAAARKGQGEVAAGDIIGADILNILWIIGVSAMVNPMEVSRSIVNFMFPWMFVIVGTMLLLMRIGYKIGRPKGILLLILYTLYLATTVVFLY